MAGRGECFALDNLAGLFALLQFLLIKQLFAAGCLRREQRGIRVNHGQNEWWRKRQSGFGDIAIDILGQWVAAALIDICLADFRSGSEHQVFGGDRDENGMAR